MDGVFTLCRMLEGCTRMDRHEGVCNVPLTLRRRTPASRLRYLAEQLEKGTDPRTVAAALRLMADEQR